MYNLKQIEQIATPLTAPQRHQRALRSALNISNDDWKRLMPNPENYETSDDETTEESDSDDSDVPDWYDPEDWETDDEEDVIPLPSGPRTGSFLDSYPGMQFPVYNIVSECEKQLLTSPLQLQRGEEGSIWSYVEAFLAGKANSMDRDWLARWIENYAILSNYHNKCYTLNDYYCLIMLSYRLITGKLWAATMVEKIKEWIQPEVQALDAGEALKTLRSVFDTVNGVGESPLARKLVSLYSFMLTQGFLARVGITLNDDDFSKMEQRAFVSAYSSRKSFAWCVADTTLFICERLHEFYLTGDITRVLHSESKYAEWLKEADRLINLAPFVGNLKAHNTSYFSYLSDLRDAIELGTSYSRYVSKATMNDANLIQRKLNSLELLQNTEITRRAAQKERMAPMGVLVFGASSIAKSSFAKILYNYYGALHGLDRSDQYRYVRNPMEEFWNNFDSSKWCIHLDDIAFRDPNKCTDIDSTLQDLLNVVNNVPYVPPQAALEDKGKTPVMSELVIATTNSMDLHADQYFSCPLAVRRRLPYIVSVKPKKEFLHENEIFIDPKKIVVEDGKFPNLWDITVNELVPVMHRGKESAKVREVAVFSEIEDFLEHFGRASIQHKENQERALLKDKDMTQIAVCKKCLRTAPCACVEVQWGVVPHFTKIWARAALDWYAHSRAHLWFLDWCLNYQITRYFMSIWLEFFGIDVLLLRYYGKLREACSNKKLQKTVVLLGAVCMGAGLYLSVQKSKKSDKKTKKESKTKDPEGEIVFDDDDSVASEFSHASWYEELEMCTVTIDGHTYRGPKDWVLSSMERIKLETQGNKLGTTEEQLEKEATRNVWYNPTIELSTFEVPKASASVAGASPEEVRNLFARNCVMLHIRIAGEMTVRKMRAVFVKGHLCVTNGHAFKTGTKEYSVTIVQSGIDQALTCNLKISIKRSDISFSNTSDLCVFQVDNIAPYKDISKFWSKTHIEPSSAIELLREEDGSVNFRTLFAINFITQIEVADMPNKYNIYLGTCSETTQSGDCGALSIAMTPRGPIIIGLHMLGKERQAGILEVQWHEIERLLKAKCIPQRPIVQAGDGPMLSCADRTRTLTAPHHKSLFRYLEKGVCEMYGSFAGFRPSPKSSVCATPLQEKFLQHYGVEVGYGKPAMSGWEPWRKNIVKMIDPQVNYDRAILAECVQEYANDIITTLPDGWEGELVELSDRAAVNGLPGVKYIDRLNASTSMGAPWGCTKKKYIVSSPCEKYPEGIDFVPEVWERVRAIEECYKQGKRAYPVSTNHLKDEATPLKKVKIKKTRLFTGMPVDWSIMVRKKLLSFVRLVQKNKYVFEACPGTVAQSAEWGQLRNYLTTFGEDQIVGGDYGSFDKKMLAAFVLSAFEVIIRVHEAAGYTPEELLELMCIAEDTAFPLSDVNGDLVMFYGTNPSGHPLTVIINSLVNALYMRYCYRVLNPKQEVRTFKERVHLMTYGDDNGMGVSTLIPWFNHTTIQKVLADIGVEYTMADKESESVPYINIRDFSFLKRTWLWNEDLGNWACPLDEESIIKSLTVWVPSKTIDEYKQTVQVIASAVSEYFFHGKEKFEKERQFLMQVVSEEPYSLYVVESTFPTYDELVERFHRASADLGGVQSVSWLEIEPSPSF